MMLVADELSEHIAKEDSLARRLRDCNSVPDAYYAVNADGSVFVFGKLMHLVRKRLQSDPEMSVEDLAEGLTTEATTTAHEAVAAWGLVPCPYEAKWHDDTGYVIRHKAFNSLLPGKYANKEHLNEALAQLLVGNVLPGNGEFVYRGQAMTLCARLEMSSLPPCPALPYMPTGDDDSYPFTHLGIVEYRPGFSPVSEELFRDARLTERHWEEVRNRISLYVGAQDATIWQCIANLPLAVFDDPGASIEACEEDDANTLRQLYPELTVLSTDSLFTLFESFQVECRYLRGCQPERDDNFFFYLLGALVEHYHPSNRCGMEQLDKIGIWAGFALINDYTVDSAMRFAADARNYGAEVQRIAFRTASAMRFLSQDSDSHVCRNGPKVKTLTDLFRMGRKHNVGAAKTI